MCPCEWSAWQAPNRNGRLRWHGRRALAGEKPGREAARVYGLTRYGYLLCVHARHTAPGPALAAPNKFTTRENVLRFAHTTVRDLRAVPTHARLFDSHHLKGLPRLELPAGSSPRLELHAGFVTIAPADLEFTPGSKVQARGIALVIKRGGTPHEPAAPRAHALMNCNHRLRHLDA